MTVAVIGEYNVLFKNNKATVKGDVLVLMKKCSVLALNEGARGAPANGIKAACEKEGWKYAYDGHSNWLLWDPKFWTPKGPTGKRQICRSAKDLGLNIRYNPSRHMLWKSLVHKDGSVHRFYVTHLPQGYAKPEGSFSDKVEWFKDIVAKEAVLTIDHITNRHINGNPKSVVEFDHLLGDMNSRQANHQQPWYPSNVWDDNWIPDTKPGSIDWMMHSKRAKVNGLHVISRTTIGKEHGLDSDHRANLKECRW